MIRFLSAILACFSALMFWQAFALPGNFLPDLAFGFSMAVMSIVVLSLADLEW